MDTLVVVFLIVKSSICCNVDDLSKCSNDKKYHITNINDTISCNRFTKDFDKADSAFNKTFRIDYEELKKASKRAANEAWEKTKHLLPESMHRHWKYD